MIGTLTANNILTMKLGNQDSVIQFATQQWHGKEIALEYQWVGCPESPDPVVVFLHEGLGCISLWKDFPRKFCDTFGFRGLVFSRYGYGQSTPRHAGEAVPVSYLQEQAHYALPALLSSLQIERPWLFGHSDGASIALLYAARFPQQLSGIVTMAPHILVEDITLDGIRKAVDAYRTTDLRARLARHHIDADSVFRGWCDTWLSPAFRSWNIEAILPQIGCPALLVQGEQDEYGTLQQIYGIKEKVTHAEVLILPDCGHSPQRDQPDTVAERAARFMRAMPIRQAG